MDTTGTYTCAYCGEESVTEVDISQGFSQRYIEDCQVCCRPNVFYVTFDEEYFTVAIQTEPMD